MTPARNHDSMRPRMLVAAIIALAAVCLLIASPAAHGQPKTTKPAPAAERKPQPTALQQANQQLAEQFQVQGFPTLLVLDSQGGSLGRLSYGQGGAKMFLAELEKLIHPPPETPPSRMAAKKCGTSSKK